ncbi:major mannose-resistant fimbrial protein [Xenorhabdus mauleonii]|uniref:Major mannose-resistant fimbrial protein n=1 Tax=Xenorhabdus mauleonii TaxID=351675 RepID=A0A1I3R8D1_9GAMM|nr:fimbrial protein [Xenorhabdus mauleonii]PHM39779.1 major mannose-resistant fimbrial protein [Xenorhabdus mauleonii]SFJ42290.1 Pilin (type 1 fimbria component protein) [Xenorhabdus mauleonii]
MKPTKLAKIAAITLGMGIFCAQAQSVAPKATPINNGGGGKITFTGTVVNAPCNISPESINQTINFGVLSQSLLNKGNETSRPVKIVLTECDTETYKKAKVTFSGANYDSKELLMSGSAKNVAVRLMGLDGDIVLDQATKAFNLSQSTNELNFMAFAKKAIGKDNVTPGEFSGTTTFTMQYE